MLWCVPVVDFEEKSDRFGWVSGGFQCEHLPVFGKSERGHGEAESTVFVLVGVAYKLYLCPGCAWMTTMYDQVSVCRLYPGIVIPF